MPVGICVLWPCCLSLQAMWVVYPFSTGSLCLKFQVCSLLTSPHSPVLRDWKLLSSTSVLLNARPRLQTPFGASVREIAGCFCLQLNLDSVTSFFPVYIFIEPKRKVGITWCFTLVDDARHSASHWPMQLLSWSSRSKAAIISPVRENLTRAERWGIVLIVHSVFWNVSHVSITAIGTLPLVLGSKP